MFTHRFWTVQLTPDAVGALGGGDHVVLLAVSGHVPDDKLVLVVLWLKVPLGKALEAYNGSTAWTVFA